MRMPAQRMGVTLVCAYLRKGWGTLCGSIHGVGGGGWGTLGGKSVGGGGWGVCVSLSMV